MRNLFQTEVGEVSPIASFMSAIETSTKAGTIGGSLGAGVAALESYDANHIESTRSSLTTNYTNLRGLLNGEHRAVLESFIGAEQAHASTMGSDWVAAHSRDCAIRLASFALEAARDPRKYYEQVAGAFAKAENDTTKVDYFVDYTNGSRAAEQGIGRGYALEAFENNNLSSAMALSVTYNLAAAVQDPAIELLFKTIVMSPEEVAVFYEIAVDRFWNGHIHGPKAKIQRNFDKALVMDAIRDPSMLHQDVLNVVPFLQTKGEGKNDDLFMPSTVKAPTTRMVAGVEILTNPLIVGKDYNLLQLSNHPALANGGTFDETDTLDSAMALDNLYLSLTASDEDGVLKLPIRHLERANFIKAVQGQSKDMELSFDSDEFVISAETLDLKGTHPEKLKAFTKLGYQLRVRLEVSAIANVETGYAKVRYANATVVGAVKVEKGEDGQADIINVIEDISKDTTLKPLVAALALNVKYFDPLMNRTNSNIRTLGILLDRDVYTAKYAIGIRSPVRYQRKVGTDESPEEILKALVRFSRLRQTGDAWAELFSYRDTLKAYVNTDANKVTRISGLIGVGKYLIRPHYRHAVVKLDEVVKSLESRNNLDNAREHLVNVMQELAAEGLVQSRWMIAAAQQNDGAQVQPHFGIVCGQYLPLLLSLRGDLRLLGENFGHTIRTTQYKEMDERIFMTLVNPESKGIDPLSFANMFVYPEVVVSVSPHVVNGGVRETFIVQPRYQPIIHLPFLIEIEVHGLKELLHSYGFVKIDVIDGKDAKALKPAAVVTGERTVPGTAGVAVSGVPGG